MPRVASTLSKKSGVICEICKTTLGRKADLPRHMKKHQRDVQNHMLSCPFPGCEHRTLQKSNLNTHIRSHTGEKPLVCPHSSANGVNCTFATGDPGSLTRHRKTKHGYVIIKGKAKTAVQAQNQAKTSTRSGSTATSGSSVEPQFAWTWVASSPVNSSSHPLGPGSSFPSQSGTSHISASDSFNPPVNFYPSLTPELPSNVRASSLQPFLSYPVLPNPQVNSSHPAHQPRWFSESPHNSFIKSGNGFSYTPREDQLDKLLMANLNYPTVEGTVENTCHKYSPASWTPRNLSGLQSSSVDVAPGQLAAQALIQPTTSGYHPQLFNLRSHCSNPPSVIPPPPLATTLPPVASTFGYSASSGYSSQYQTGPCFTQIDPHPHYPLTSSLAPISGHSSLSGYCSSSYQTSHCFTPMNLQSSYPTYPTEPGSILSL